MEILRKNRKKNARDQKHITEMMNAFDELISGLDMAQDIISEFEDISIETSKTKKNWKNGIQYPRNVKKCNTISQKWGTISKNVTC